MGREGKPMTTFWVDDAGKMAKATDDSQDLSQLHPINTAPESGKQVWDFVAKNWGPVPLSPKPLAAEELYDMLAAKGIIIEQDRPRPKED